MRTWGWVGVGFAATLGLAGALAFGAAYYVQHTDMREWAAWGAKKAGVEATFGGPIEVKLWPHILVKARNVQVASLQGKGPLASIEALALQAEWGAGLTPWRGIQVRAIEAKNPTLTLTRNAAGMANWAPAQAAKPAATPAVATDPHNPLGPLTTQGGVLAAVRLAIANLNLSYTDAQSGQTINIQNMNIGARTSGTVATTTLKGQINGQPLVGELVADVAAMNEIPLKGRLEGAGAALAMEGRVTTQRNGESGFAGLINARSTDLRATLTTLLGKAPAQAPASLANLTGDVVLNPNQVVLRNFSARLGELLQARGEVDIALGATPKGVGNLTIQGANLRALTELFSGAKQPALPAKPFNIQGRLAGEKTFELHDLVFNIEPIVRVAGTIRITPHMGAAPDIGTALTLTAPNFAQLLAAFGQPIKAPTASLQATLNIEGKGGTYTLKAAEAQLAELAKLTAIGTVKMQGASPVLDIQAEVQGTNMAMTGAGFGVSQLPSSGFSLRAKVRGSGPYELEGLTINLPGLVQALANLNLQTGTPTNLGGEITISQLNATKLGYCGSATNTAGANSEGGRAAASAAAPWSDAPLNLSALRNFGLNLKVQASGLSCANYPVQQASFTLRNTPSQLDIEDLNLTLATEGGSMKGKVNLMHAGTPQLNTTLQVQALRPEVLVPSLAARGLRLPLTGAIELASQGASSRAMAQSLGGKIALQATQGQLPYTNMLGNVVALERLLQGATALPTNGNGSVDNFSAVLVFRQGLGVFEEMKIGTGNGTMSLQGAGQLDLPNWTIDLTLTPQLATSSGLAIPILVRGPLSAPAIGADPAFTQKLTQRLATEGLKSALGLDKTDAKGLGGAIGEVLGGKGLSAEGVGNLLNSFGKKPPEPSPTNPTPPATPTAGTEPTPEAAPQANPANALEQALPGLLNNVLGQ